MMFTSNLSKPSEPKNASGTNKELSMKLREPELVASCKRPEDVSKLLSKPSSLLRNKRRKARLSHQPRKPSLRNKRPRSRLLLGNKKRSSRLRLPKRPEPPK